VLSDVLVSACVSEIYLAVYKFFSVYNYHNTVDRATLIDTFPGSPAMGISYTYRYILSIKDAQS